MLWIIALILFGMWAWGLVTSYTLSGFIHILPVLALASAKLLGLDPKLPLPDPDPNEPGPAPVP